MKISVMIIAKDEEKSIATCLDSVRFADEVVVIDDYSKDSTVKLAKQHGAKVYQRTLDGFASQKNFGIKKCCNKWVLILDADESLTKELQSEIEALKPKTIVAYDIPFRNYVGEYWLKHGGLYPDRHTRLINKDFAQYGSREIHETLVIKGKVGHLNNDIIHKTYANYKEYLAKVKKYATLEAKEDKQKPRLVMPIKVFYGKFLKEQGYKDGMNGLKSALLLSYYQYYKRKMMQ
jgi:glycosyltransferase involved in cell wall biosynthesis